MTDTRFPQIARLIASALLFVSLASSVWAGTISTPKLVNSAEDGQLTCTAINVSDQVRSVTVDLYIRRANNTQDVISRPCPALAPNDVLGCPVFVNEKQAISAFCKITAPGSDSRVRRYFRGALVHRDEAFPAPPTAAVEAR